jgi:two-component system chemotaxis sensor kinase CheA
MSSGDLVAQVERLGEDVLLADPADLSGLAELHTLLQETAASCTGSGFPRMAEAALAAASLIENIITEDEAHPTEALAAIGQAVQALAAVVSGETPDGEAALPPKLGIAGPALASVGEAASHRPALVFPSNVDDEIFSEFLSLQDGVLEQLEERILNLDTGDTAEVLASIKRTIHTLKGESAMLGLDEIEHLCHTVEDILLERPSPTLADPLLQLRDWLQRAFDFYKGKGPMPESAEGLLAQFRLAEQAAAGAGDLAGTSKGDHREAAPAPPSPPPPAPTNEAVEEPQPLQGDPDLLHEFCAEAMEHLDNADVHLLTLETTPTEEDALNAVFRAFHTIKGVAGFLALEAVQRLAHEAENMLDRARKGELVLAGPAIDAAFASVDMLKRLIGHVRHALESGGPLMPEPGVPSLVTEIQAAAAGMGSTKAKTQIAPSPKPVGEILIDEGLSTEEAIERALREQEELPQKRKLGEILVQNMVTSSVRIDQALAAQDEREDEPKLGEVLRDMGTVAAEDIEAALQQQAQAPERAKVGEILVRTGVASASDVAQALRAQEAAREGGASRVQVREAVKVDADRLDLLVDMIGELVIAESMVVQSAEMRAHASTTLERQLGQLDKITRELQEMAMSLRMVPVRPTFQKMARLVRDLAKKSGKPVEYKMTGEDTELDKSVVDKIGDPLVHMVRNAVDHGLEATAEARIAAGKSPTGTVHLRAFHQGGSIHLQIQDDGHGLDRDRIIAKAIERGIIKNPDGMSDREVWNLIFEPGFSTAAKVTEVSGRGVGMDVVRRNIEALRGEVEIRSEKGAGTTFTIKLPLTLAIIDGMVIRVGSERYAVPTLSIVLSLRPKSGEVETVAGRGEMIKLRDKLIPVVRLQELFHLPGPRMATGEGIVLVVENDGKQTGLLIDEMLGQQQIVIKSLGVTLQGTPGVAGGAIMPDGRVGLILDVGGLIKLATG